MFRETVKYWDQLQEMISQKIIKPTLRSTQYGGTLFDNEIKGLLNMYSFYTKQGITISHYKSNFEQTMQEIQRAGGDPERLMYNLLDYEKSDTNVLLQFVHITKGYDIFELACKHPNYIKNASLALQTEQSHKIAVIRVNDTQTIILTSRLDQNMVIPYLSLIPIVFKNDLIPEQLIKALLFLSEYDYTNASEEINKLMDTMDVKEIYKETIKECLRISFTQQEVKARLKDNIRNKNIELQEMYIAADRLIKQITGMQMKLEAPALVSDEKTTEELLEFLMSHKYIKEVIPQKEYNMITMKIISPIMFIDENLIEKLLENNQTYLNEAVRANSTLEKFIRQTFIEKKYTLITKTMIKVDVGKLIRIIEGLDQNNDHINSILSRGELQDKKPIPNPHIMYHNCYGNNETHLHKAVEQKNIIGFIAQAIGATQNLNFADSLVMRELIRDLISNRSNSKTIIDNKTNEVLTYNEWEERSNKE